MGNMARELIEPSLTGQLSPVTLARLTLLLIPLGLTYGLPMGMLTGVLLTLGRLSADSEITAMRACGISLARISVPVLILGALGAAAALPINFEYMPRTRWQYDQEFTAALRANPLNLIAPKTFIRAFSGVVAYVGEKQGTELKDCWIWRVDSERRVTNFVHAATGHVEYDAATNDLILTLFQAQVEKRDPKNPENLAEPDQVGTSEEIEPERFSLNSIFSHSNSRQKPDWKTYGELRLDQIRLAAAVVPPAEKKEHARAAMEVAMTIQRKANLALAALAFAFIGIPLGIKVSRRETSANLGLAVMLALGYYFLSVMVGWLDRHPEYRPDLLLWAPNVIFFVLGAWLFSRIDRR